jgi:hypothetical protein
MSGTKNSGGRPRRQDVNVDLMARLWREGVPTTEIGYRCGTTASAVQGYAHRFRDRFPYRGYVTSDRRPTNRVWAGNQEAEYLRRLEAALAVEEPKGPVPTLYRCWNCGGKTDTPRGHPGCRYT